MHAAGALGRAQLAAGAGERGAAVRSRAGLRAGCSASAPARARRACCVEASTSRPQETLARFAASTVTVLGAAAFAAACLAEPAFAEARPDENLLSDFNVEFLGSAVDHKVIVEWVVLGQTVGFIGSLVGGWSAKERKEEVEKLNARLLVVNKQLREQARAAKSPTLSPDVPVKVPSTHADTEDQSPEAQELLKVLRTGKGLLKERNGTAALESFEKALGMARSHATSLESPWKAERKALRGMGAAHNQLGQHDRALDYMKQVLTISEKMADTSGVADAMGVIADIYTDKGELDKAAKWYDKYLDEMTK